MDAILLVGGLGTRLSSLVSEVPKCIAPVAGRPFLYYLLRFLKQYHVIDRVIFAVGYKHRLIVEWVESQKDIPFEYVFSYEEVPLGTGGAIKRALQYVQSEDVIIVNGDTLFTINIDRLLALHEDKDSCLSIALKHMYNFDRYGSVETDQQGMIVDFYEKTYCAEGDINGGIYVLRTSCAKMMYNMPDKFSFETDFLRPHVGNHMYGFCFNNYFIDIGVPIDLERANNELNTMV